MYIHIIDERMWIRRHTDRFAIAERIVNNYIGNCKIVYNEFRN